MGLLDGKRILVTGITTDDSIAYAVAEQAMAAGADVALTSFGRVMSLTKRVARKLPAEPPVFELDVTSADDVANLAGALRDHGWDTLDGAVHSIGYAPPSCLGQGMFEASWDDVGTAMHASAYSLKALAEGVLPLMGAGASIVGFTFDATVAWPAYDWMGPVKAAFEATSRYLARDLGPRGIRVNLVAAGPIRSVAAKSIPGFSTIEGMWSDRAPLGWNVSDATAVGRTTVALLSDWMPATTGEIVHVDGGFHSTGA
ncbi:MAG: enoyl-ACP reductase FabI [Acidobacteria bacterium]|nr:enoyl-ACP reductase FabI [Acidobacteriota bacterium]